MGSAHATRKAQVFGVRQSFFLLYLSLWVRGQGATWASTSAALPLTLLCSSPVHLSASIPLSCLPPHFHFGPDPRFLVPLSPLIAHSVPDILFARKTPHKACEPCKPHRKTSDSVPSTNPGLPSLIHPLPISQNPSGPRALLFEPFRSLPPAVSLLHPSHRAHASIRIHSPLSPGASHRSPPQSSGPRHLPSSTPTSPCGRLLCCPAQMVWNQSSACGPPHAWVWSPPHGCAHAASSSSPDSGALSAGGALARHWQRSRDRPKYAKPCHDRVGKGW